MERQAKKRETFILKETKPFRRFLRLYVKSSDNKQDLRNIPFTTEHKVSEKERTKNARKIHAEFSTSDENVIDALYRDTGYGITFTHKDDPNGERKLESFKITPVDAKKIALQKLFEAAELEFDPSLSVGVLEEQYRIHVTAKAGGNKIGESTATSIPHTPIDVAAQLSNAMESGIKEYEEKYGEKFPDFERKEDSYAFIDALQNPDFDPKAYLEEKFGGSDSDDDNSNSLPDTPEELQELYFATFKKKVANLKKNDVAWMKAQIEAERAK